MRGIHHLNRMIFFLFSGRGHRHRSTAQKQRMARVEAASRSPEVQAFWDKLKEVRNAHIQSIVGDDSMPNTGSTVIRAEPGEGGGIPDRAGIPANRSDTDTVTPIVTSAPNWETLEKQLQKIVQENPDIREVEVKHD